jgi:hypothetical protein
MDVGRSSYNLLSDTVCDIFPYELRKAINNNSRCSNPICLKFHVGVVRMLLRCLAIYYSVGLYVRIACSAYVMNTISFLLSTAVIVIKIEIN